MRTIVVDYRERPSQTCAALLNMSAVRVVFRALETGDYWLPGRVLVERKTADDFEGSIVDGRIFKQARRLRQTSSQPLFLVEWGAGAARHRSRRGVSSRARLGTLVALNLVWGIPILYADSPAESAWLLTNIADQRTRTSYAQRARPRNRHIKRAHKQIDFLTGLPGVGPKRANALMERFGSVQGVINASPAQLQKVEGIGLKTAEAMHAFLIEK